MNNVKNMIVFLKVDFDVYLYLEIRKIVISFIYWLRYKNHDKY